MCVCARLLVACVREYILKVMPEILYSVPLPRPSHSRIGRTHARRLTCTLGLIHTVTGVTRVIAYRSQFKAGVNCPPARNSNFGH